MTTPQRTIDALLGPLGDEIDCDECFDSLDRYVDDELAGRDADGATPGMRAHLVACSACHDEYETLSALAGASQNDEER